MPVRVLGVNNGDGIDSDIADAIRWTTGVAVGSLPKPAQPAHIVNLSFGGPGISFTLQRAIDAAVSRGSWSSPPLATTPPTPRRIRLGGLDGVITMARSIAAGQGQLFELRTAGRSAGARGRCRRSGPRRRHGPVRGRPRGDGDVGILSTYRDDGIPEPGKPPFTYGMLAGTSQATPHVTGAAALVKAILPGVRQHTLARSYAPPRPPTTSAQTATWAAAAPGC